MSTEARRVVVDPITRIEGHLRIEAETDADGVIQQAYSAGTMVRGIEIILRGRDPRDAWAFAQRICGVCTLVHGIASVRAVEDALGYQVPANANLVRNLMIGSQYVHDHVMHFYHLHALDWVDVVSALSADPAATSTLAQSLSSYPRSSPGHFADVQRRVKALVESGQLGIFANAYWGHPAYKLPPEANLMAVAHYLDALAWQRDVAALHAIFGGKNPHPHFLVGGVPNPIDLNSDSAINTKRLSQVQEIITRMREFVDQVYVPDTLAIAGFYKDWPPRGRASAISCAMATSRRPPSTIRQSSWCRAASSWIETCRISRRSICTTRRRSRNSSPMPGTTTPTENRQGCIPTMARPRSTTRVRSRPTSNSTWTMAIPG
jgi:hydrogenase large subunit